MSFLGWLGLTKGIGKDIAQPIDAISNLYTTDKARLQGEKELTEIEQRPQLAAIDLNKIFAASSNFFNSAYIPLLGWTCGFLILIFYAPQIIIITYVWGMNTIHSGIVTQFPMSPNDLLHLIGLLFGVGMHSLAKK
jgi:hypothetical protein